MSRFILEITKKQLIIDVPSGHKTKKPGTMWSLPMKLTNKLTTKVLQESTLKATTPYKLGPKNQL